MTRYLYLMCVASKFSCINFKIKRLIKGALEVIKKKKALWVAFTMQLKQGNILKYLIFCLLFEWKIEE
jgi:hypothetical protein